MKRVTTVSKRFREPGNTDVEVKNVEAKKRRSMKKELKTHQAEAQTKNIEYLIKDFESHAPSTSVVNKTLAEHTETSAQEQSTLTEKVREEETAELSMGLASTDLPPFDLVNDAGDSSELMESYDEWMQKILNNDDQYEFGGLNIDEFKNTEVQEETIVSENIKKSDDKQPRMKEQSEDNESMLSKNLTIELGNLEVEEETENMKNSDNNEPVCDLALQLDQPLQLDLSLFDLTSDSLETKNKDPVVELMEQEVSKFVNHCNNEVNAVNVVEERNLIVINFDEITKKSAGLESENKDLKLEINKLKSDLDDANKRNLLLQKYLVAADERVAQAIYVEKDKGRLYRGGVFLNKKQCEVLDKSKTDREFLNNLTLAIFGRTVLQNSSVTGAPSNKTKRSRMRGDSENGCNDSGDAKDGDDGKDDDDRKDDDDGKDGNDGKNSDTGKSKLNPDLLQLVYDIMDARSVANRTEKLSTAKKNVIIAKKCSNAAAYADKKTDSQ